jgi:site-specific DNA-cytosine methylase
MENVGMLVHRGLREVLGSLAEIGYDAEWQDIRASDVGAPHRRERIWIVAYPASISCDCEYIHERYHAQAIQEERFNRSCEKADMANAKCDGLQGVGNGGNFKKENESHEGGEAPRENNERAIPDPNNNQATRQRKYGGKIFPESETKRFNSCSSAGRWATEPAVGRLVNGLSTVLDGNLRRLYNADVNDSETISKIDNHYKSILFGMRTKRKTSTSSCGGKSGFSYSLVSKMPYKITHDEWYMGKWIEKDEVLCNMWQVVLSGEENIQDLLAQMSVRIRENQRNEKMASQRVDRLQGLGNAIVPQIAELLFRQIKQFIQE